ncbi:actin binding protein [Umbelopsis sp. WA50703]
MSLQVGFSTHSKDLQSAYEQVINSNSPVNWLIYTYDKGTNDLKVQATGEDGLEELSEEFIDGRIQYALARVTDPNTELPKLVFIAWCGTGVPESRKGLFNSHLNDVSKYFKSFHVQINARNEGDVDPDAIMKRVSESSGANYSFHKESRRMEPAIIPVGSVYKRTEIPDIAAMQRQTMKSEPAPAPVNSVHQPVRTTPGKLASRWGQDQDDQSKADQVRADRERAEKEAQEREQDIAAEREQRAREESARMEERQRAQQEADSQRMREQEQDRQRQEEELQRQHQEDVQRQRDEEDLQRQHEEELERQRLEEEEIARQHQAEQQRLAEEETESARKQQEEDERQREEQVQLEAELDASAQHAAQTAEHAADEAVQHQQDGGLSAVVLFAYDAAEDNEMSMAEGEVIHNIEQLDEGWWSGVSEDGTRSGLFPSNYVQLLETAPEVHEQVQAEPEPEAEPAAAEPIGPSALGLYDYDAGEDNEISFKENEIIRDIQFVSDDWWSGLAPDGTTVGLFPANYVELQQ